MNMNYTNLAWKTLAKDLNDFTYQIELLYKKLIQKKELNKSLALVESKTNIPRNYKDCPNNYLFFNTPPSF